VTAPTYFETNPKTNANPTITLKTNPIIFILFFF
jgi:hypothetical protein